MLAPIGAASLSEARAGAPRSATRSRRRSRSGGHVDGGRRRGRVRPEVSAAPRRCSSVEAIGSPRGSRPAPRSHRAGPRGPELFRDGRYQLEGGEDLRDGHGRSSGRTGLLDGFPIVSIEVGGPLAQDDWEGWSVARPTPSGRVPDRRRRPVRDQPGPPRGIREGVATAILIKVNQIGTLTETLDAIELAAEGGVRSDGLNRAWRNEDTTITDLVVDERRADQVRRSHAASGPRSTTACSGSRRSWAIRLGTRARRRSAGGRHEAGLEAAPTSRRPGRASARWPAHRPRCCCWSRYPSWW